LILKTKWKIICYINYYALNSIMTKKSKEYERIYVSKWFDSIRFRFGFCWIGSLPGWNRHSAGSVRFGFGFFRFRFKRQKIQKLLRLSWRCVVINIYICIFYT
jgi:hypothetical protein